MASRGAPRPPAPTLASPLGFVTPRALPPPPSLRPAPAPGAEAGKAGRGPRVPPRPRRPGAAGRVRGVRVSAGRRPCGAGRQRTKARLHLFDLVREQLLGAVLNVRRAKHSRAVPDAGHLGTLNSQRVQ